MTELPEDMAWGWCMFCNRTIPVEKYSLARILSRYFKCEECKNVRVQNPRY